MVGWPVIYSALAAFQFHGSPARSPTDRTDIPEEESDSAAEHRLTGSICSTNSSKMMAINVHYETFD